MHRIKITLCVIIILLGYGCIAQDISQAARWIKIGNTLRETKQFAESLNYLEQGVGLATRLKDRYWQAVAYENMGLTYRDKNDITGAARYFKKALDIYKEIKTPASAKALQQLYDGVSNTNNLYGGIDIGARGVKATIIGVKLSSDGAYKFDPVFSSSINTSPALCTPQAFNETAKAVRTLLDTLLGRKIPKEKIFIVGSSGLKNELERPECGKKEELLALINKELSAVYQQPIAFIDACKEAELEMTGTVNARDWATSAIVDIGSGNVKGGYFQNDNFECIDFLSINPFVKYVQSQKKDLPFAEAAAAVYKDDIGPNLVRPEISRKPLFQTRDKIYMIGGIVYAMTTYMHPSEFNKAEVVFTYSEVVEFRKRAIEDYKKLTNPDISGIDDEALYKSVKKAIEKPVFNQEDLIAGAILLEGIMSELKKTNPGKEYVFNRNGYVGWISGYILNMLRKDYQQTTEQ